ncbi:MULTISPECIES: sensor histidine kinase [unclassified Nocardiopsis]|uniref:sensor histidine kinase n=1 Tax=Nocardiopsis TaxID=2013 RepID=UPI00387AE6B3
MEGIRRYAPDAALAMPVLTLGVLEVVARLQGAPTLLEMIVYSGLGAPLRGLPFDAVPYQQYSRVSMVATAAVVTAGSALACALARHQGALALVVVWFTGLIQLWRDGDILAAQLSVAYVAFALACWGGRTVLWASLASIPVGAVLVTTHVLDQLGLVSLYGRGPLSVVVANYLFVAPIAALLLGVPWLVGLAVRTARSAQASQQARVEAEQEAARSDEIARLRAEQTRLARDVHDVVGHSLAVILAQAESAQFRDLKDERMIQETLANIAATSRRSLNDVRSVLTSTSEGSQAEVPDSTDLNDLVEGVRTAGNDVESSVGGIPRPLPPEIHVVAYRTLQEMLTNALKHGRRGTGVRVGQHWDDGLYLEVENTVDTSAPDARDSPGLGQRGMVRRLESVGGWLSVGQKSADGEERYVARAWLPFRAARKS